MNKKLNIKSMFQPQTSMKKALLLSLGALGCLLQGASASAIYTTEDDFALFYSGSATTSTAYYSESGTVNGIGNPSNAGGTGAFGSLELTAGGGWTSPPNSEPTGPTAASFTALFPGSLRPYSPESGFGAGTMLATSGTMTFDIYRGNFTSWHQFGIFLNYDSHFDVFLWNSSTDFTGADGRTWTHVEVPYTTSAVSLNYFQMGFRENSDGAIAGQTFYIDNIQIIEPAPVPEPTTWAMLLGGFGMLLGFQRSRRRSSRV